MAIDLEAPDLAAKHRAGKFPPPYCEQGAQANALQGLKELRSALRPSFGAAAGTALVAVAILWLTGNISVSQSKPRQKAARNLKNSPFWVSNWPSAK